MAAGKQKSGFGFTHSSIHSSKKNIYWASARCQIPSQGLRKWLCLKQKCLLPLWSLYSKQGRQAWDFLNTHLVIELWLQWVLRKRRRPRMQQYASKWLTTWAPRKNLFIYLDTCVCYIVHNFKITIKHTILLYFKFNAHN